jgi:UDP-glucose 4-epimerase
MLPILQRKPIEERSIEYPCDRRRRLYRQSRLQSQRVRAVLERYRPSALMHFAAYAYVGESVTPIG